MKDKGKMSNMNNLSTPMPYNLPQNQCCQCGKPPIKERTTEVNAVKIELINPQAYGSAPADAPMSNPMIQAPSIYSYPQTQIYPSNPIMDEGPTYFMHQEQEQKQVPFLPQQPLSRSKSPERSMAPEPPTEKFKAVQTPVMKEVPTALVDQKANTEVAKPKAETSKPEIPPAKEEKPAIDVKPIIGSLKSENMAQQFSAIQQIAEIGQNPKVPSDFLVNEEIFKGLTSIMTKDTSNMPGPTAEQTALREKKFSGTQLTPEQDKLAETLAPQEEAEMNKQYATYALAVVQKNFRTSVNKEASKQGLEPVKLNEIPEIDKVIENIKSNKNPLIREASISALAYISQPEDKETLGIIFSIATEDQDPLVRETAKKAHGKLTK